MHSHKEPKEKDMKFLASTISQAPLVWMSKSAQTHTQPPI